jgi:hypothetical protein
MTHPPHITEIVRRGPRIFIAWHKPIEADDHTIVVPPEDRCLVVPPPVSGRERLRRGLEALLEAHERHPDGMRKLSCSVVKTMFPHEAERITAILEGQSSPDGLRTPAEAAHKLHCSVKTLNGYVKSGALKYVAIGHGKKRQRKMFADPDLNEFIANQTRKDVPCPSTRTETAARRISTSTSKCEVIGFMARRNARRAVRPKK